jgi:hypothetical protein
MVFKLVFLSKINIALLGSCYRFKNRISILVNFQGIYTPEQDKY